MLSEDTDQITQICKLNWIFAVRTSEGTFSDAVGHIFVLQSVCVYDNTVKPV